VLQFEFTKIGPAVECEKKSRFLSFRFWLPSLNGIQTGQGGLRYAI